MHSELQRSLNILLFSYEVMQCYVVVMTLNCSLCWSCNQGVLPFWGNRDTFQPPFFPGLLGPRVLLVTPEQGRPEVRWRLG